VHGQQATCRAAATGGGWIVCENECVLIVARVSVAICLQPADRGSRHSSGNERVRLREVRGGVRGDLSEAESVADRGIRQGGGGEVGLYGRVGCGRFLTVGGSLALVAALVLLLADAARGAMGCPAVWGCSGSRFARMV
jgi:hypothetical protein